MANLTELIDSLDKLGHPAYWEVAAEHYKKGHEAKQLADDDRKAAREASIDDANPELAAALLESARQHQQMADIYSNALQSQLKHFAVVDFGIKEHFPALLGDLLPNDILEIIKANPQAGAIRYRAILGKVLAAKKANDGADAEGGKSPERWSDLHALHNQLKPDGKTDAEIVAKFRRRFAQQWNTHRTSCGSVAETEQSLCKVLKNYRAANRRGTKKGAKLVGAKKTSR